MLQGCEGFIGLSITPVLIFRSDQCVTFLVLLFDLKNGNPLRGRSLTIRYVLDKAWNVNIKEANTPPTTREGSIGAGGVGKRIGSKSLTKEKITKDRTREKIIQYRVLRISLGDTIDPSGNLTPSLNLGESAESSENGLLKATTIQLTNERNTKEIKARLRLPGAIRRDMARGVSQGMRMEILFFVQNIPGLVTSSKALAIVVSFGDRFSHGDYFTTLFLFLQGVRALSGERQQVFSTPRSGKAIHAVV